MTASAQDTSGEGWRPAAFNQGWTYRDRTGQREQGRMVSVLLAARHRHSSVEDWKQRIQRGELRLNGALLASDRPLPAAAELLWSRPPWVEPAIPDAWTVIHDDGDVLVIHKPSGLPVMPGGGFLEHTLERLLVQRCRDAGEEQVPKPVHRLGRFTSGLQVCARRGETRARLSRAFRPDGGSCKLYQAWAHRVNDLEPGATLRVDTDVIERPHPLLGWVWGPEPQSAVTVRRRLQAHSEVSLLKRTSEGDRLQVAITTGRPHQIRIHLAQLGSPLLGDPLYLQNQQINEQATPGDGGYRLHAWRLSLDGLALCCEPGASFG